MSSPQTTARAGQATGPTMGRAVTRAGAALGAGVRHAPRAWELAAERARLSVVPRGTTRAARVPFVTLVVSLLLGGVIGLLVFNTSMQEASFAATEKSVRAQAMEAKRQNLEMTLEDLRDPQHVATRARGLGMVPAAPAFLRLSDGTVLGEPELAGPEDVMRIAPLPTRKPKALDPDPLIIRLERPEPTVPSGQAGTAGAASTEGGRGGGRTEQTQDEDG